MRLFLAQFLVLLSFVGYTQKFKTFKKLPPPEKIWVITHPFVAGKAYKISLEAKNVADSLTRDTTVLDGDGNGGQVDAFRHAYWMARLTSEIGWRRSRSLGNAHEKGNYWQYKKGILEDGALPDKESSDMDFLNNDIGRDVGLEYKNISKDSLQKVIIKMILDGELWILWKDKNGNFLDCEGNVIPDSLLHHKWETPKCLVPSNKKRLP